MNNQTETQKPEALGFQQFTYTKEQLRQLIVAWLDNNWGIRATLECSELIWPGRNYSFAASMIDKIWEHSKRVIIPEGTSITPDVMVDSILESIWKDFEKDTCSITLLKHESIMP